MTLLIILCLLLLLVAASTPWESVEFLLLQDVTSNYGGVVSSTATWTEFWTAFIVSDDVPQPLDDNGMYGLSVFHTWGSPAETATAVSCYKLINGLQNNRAVFVDFLRRAEEKLGKVTTSDTTLPHSALMAVSLAAVDPQVKWSPGGLEGATTVRIIGLATGSQTWQ